MIRPTFAEVQESRDIHIAMTVRVYMRSKVNNMQKNSASF